MKFWIVTWAAISAGVLLGLALLDALNIGYENGWQTYLIAPLCMAFIVYCASVLDRAR